MFSNTIMPCMSGNNCSLIEKRNGAGIIRNEFY